MVRADSSDGHGDEGMGSAYILQIELTGVDDGLDMEGEEERGIRTAPYVGDLYSDKEDRAGTGMKSSIVGLFRF